MGCMGPGCLIGIVLAPVNAVIKLVAGLIASVLFFVVALPFKLLGKVVKRGK